VFGKVNIPSTKDQTLTSVLSISKRIKSLRSNKFEVSYKFFFFFLRFAAPDGHEETKELEVYNFTGAGGVALAMYNTDEVCI
jgi:hypothetical protein